MSSSKIGPLEPPSPTSAAAGAAASRAGLAQSGSVNAVYARHVDKNAGGKFVTNVVRTTRYTMASFVPLAVFNQVID